MPFVWRKMRSGRISQLVNDHLDNSRKRRDGCSLFVETGFPTSLVDLFMKNQGKLKKPSKGKLFGKCSVDAEDPLPSPPPQTPSYSIHSVTEEILSTVGEDESSLPKNDGISSNSIAFKMFLVVFLLLGTNNFSIGISISAFVLFFPDHVVNSVFGNLFLCLETKGIFWRKAFVADTDKQHQILMRGLKSSAHGRELVETIASPATLVKEVQALSDTAEDSCSETYHDVLQMKQEPEKTSKKGKNIKSKLRKLFSKRSQKQGDPPKAEQPNESQGNRDPEFGLRFHASGRDTCESTEINARETEEHRVKETGDTSLSLVSFVVVVGLVASNRPFAILLTVLWCMLPRSGKRPKLSLLSKFMGVFPKSSDDV